MADAPDPEPASRARWRQWGSQRLTTARDLSQRGWRGARRAWERLLASLQDEELARDPAPPPPGPLVEQRDAPRLIPVPARGYVYSFHLRVSLAWSSSSSVRAEALNWYARYFTPHAIQRLVRLATDAARDLAPHRAADLEMHLQRALAEQGPWRYERGDVVVTCQPDVSVRLDEHIRQAIQPHVDRLVTLECTLDEHLKQARSAEQLSQRWIGILDEHLEAAGTDRDLADARRHLLAAYEAAAEWIDDLLAQRPARPT